MTPTIARDWAERLASIWENRDMEAASELFKATCTYLESPFSSNAAATPEGIRRLWSEAMDQDHSHIAAKIECIQGRNFVATYTANYRQRGTQRRTYGVWLVELDTEGLCTSFRQVTAADPNDFHQ